MSDTELAEVADRTTVFAKLSPAQKERVMRALHAKGHVVGFLGDGINDSPALKAADVGISVDTAVDIAKESADIILLEKSLLVLQEGVIEGRKVFGNITKYIKMGASSNFGNMFSVLGASIFLPFLPMAPIQVLTNNLLYDFSQTDDPDRQCRRGISGLAAQMGHRQHLQVHGLHRADQLDLRLRDLCHDAVSSSTLEQSVAVPDRLVRRIAADPDADHSHHPHREDPVPREPRQSGADRDDGHHLRDRDRLALHWAGSALGFVPLPWLYWPLVAAMMVTYAVLTHLVKVWFTRRWGL